MKRRSPAQGGPLQHPGALAHPSLTGLGSPPACPVAPPASLRVGAVAGSPHPRALHHWLPDRPPICRRHPPHLLRPPPPHPATRLSCAGPFQRVGAVATGPNASLPMAWWSCARPVATPSTRRSSATSSTSMAAAPMALAATSSTTPLRTWLFLATPTCCARASASQACPLAAEARHHRRV